MSGPDGIVQSTAWALSRLADSPGYPPTEAMPYGPGESYPEFPGLPRGALPNPVFRAVRDVLRGLGLDSARFGTPQWNPLGDLVKPGGKIVVKPNWVMHRNQGPGGMGCMITHPAVLRAVMEYVFLTKPSHAVLGDAPLQGCEFEQLLDFGGLRAVIADFQTRKLPLVVKDFRRTILHEEEDQKIIREELRPESDYVLVDLGSDSLLEPISRDWKKFRVTVYDPRKMWAHHRPGRHRYLIARDILDADLVVNVPKLKAHKKAGITCCLKNLIGINGNKEYLPHHRKGAAEGKAGDNYAHRHWEMVLAETTLDLINRGRGYSRIYRLGERVVWWLMHFAVKKDPELQIEGSWYGNDTIWRTCLDLNRALLYADRGGNLRDAPQREELSVVDAIVAGQGDGPLDPMPLDTQAVFAARNPAVGDVLGSLLLGFDPAKIPLVRHAGDAMRWRISETKPEFPAFEPPFSPARAPRGWAGYVERDPEPAR